MSAIKSALMKFRQEPDVRHADTFFRLVSVVSEPAAPHEVEAAWRGAAIPPDAAALWATCREARLFEDADYGQWGLVLLDPEASARRSASERATRPSEFREEDVVVGSFLGDQELLVIAPTDACPRQILIALPLDRRADWVVAAGDLSEFLRAYFAAGGNKFWERSNN